MPRDTMSVIHESLYRRIQGLEADLRRERLRVQHDQQMRRIYVAQEHHLDCLRQENRRLERLVDNLQGDIDALTARNQHLLQTLKSPNATHPTHRNAAKVSAAQKSDRGGEGVSQNDGEDGSIGPETGPGGHDGP